MSCTRSCHSLRRVPGRDRGNRVWHSGQGINETPELQSTSNTILLSLLQHVELVWDMLRGGDIPMTGNTSDLTYLLPSYSYTCHLATLKG